MTVMSVNAFPAWVLRSRDYCRPFISRTQLGERSREMFRGSNVDPGVPCFMIFS
jgi:hypothetical protein